jgi:hypothetical protein
LKTLVGATICDIHQMIITQLHHGLSKFHCGLNA